MSHPYDTIQRVRELADEGHSHCNIERWTDIPRNEVRRILGKEKNRPPPLATNELSTRQRTMLLNWKRPLLG